MFLPWLELEMDQETKWRIERTEELIAASKKEIEDYKASIVKSELEIKRLGEVLKKALKKSTKASKDGEA
jgi:hypothetical protein